MMNLIFLMDLILLQTAKTTLSLSLKKQTLAANPPVQIYANKIKKRIVFKVETRYKLELLSPETMKLSVSIKKMLTKIKTEKMCQN